MPGKLYCPDRRNCRTDGIAGQAASPDRRNREKGRNRSIRNCPCRFFLNYSLPCSRSQFAAAPLFCLGSSSAILLTWLSAFDTAGIEMTMIVMTASTKM